MFTPVKMINNTSISGDFQASESSEISADQLLQNLHMLLEEGTHHRGEVRSCYISHPFANDRHNHFRDFNGAQRGWSSSSHIVAGAKESFSEYHHISGACSELHSVINQGPEPEATDNQSAACQSSTTSLKQSNDVDLAHRLQSCHICDPRFIPSSRTTFNGMEWDVSQNHQHGHLNPEGLGHSCRDVFPNEECQLDVPSHIDLMQP